ncbi:hypothetical protein RFI_18145 [Reticulomyxa filosa]|uniref:Uncharacterized protein n=1 Tax=Reticulomyxa filosa TaxID=46433 RepID=X6MZ44_RETFI|nr:hypothetical protein RFI_18145 [Reticulomyxa filosa]|eukprot:ETO19091.1 hypothetical protein RFI_18145 [Reticulomyxa filosa]
MSAILMCLTDVTMYLKYLVLDLIKHKLAILYCGWYLNRVFAKAKLPPESFHVSWTRLLLHDLSKFRMDEFVPYARFFRGNKDEHCREFEKACRRHFLRNDHHSEYWDLASYKMSWEALLELVTDWFAAEFSYNGSWPRPGLWLWVQRNWNNPDKLKFHPQTKILLQALLCFLGFAEDVGGFPVVNLDYTHEGDLDLEHTERFKELSIAYRQTIKKKQ